MTNKFNKREALDKLGIKRGEGKYTMPLTNLTWDKNENVRTVYDIEDMIISMSKEGQLDAVDVRLEYDNDGNPVARLTHGFRRISSITEHNRRCVENAPAIEHIDEKSGKKTIIVDYFDQKPIENIIIKLVNYNDEQVLLHHLTKNNHKNLNAGEKAETIVTLVKKEWKLADIASSTGIPYADLIRYKLIGERASQKVMNLLKNEEISMSVAYEIVQNNTSTDKQNEMLEKAIEIQKVDKKSSKLIPIGAIKKAKDSMSITGKLDKNNTNKKPTETKNWRNIIESLSIYCDEHLSEIDKTKAETIYNIVDFCRGTKDIETIQNFLQKEKVEA